MNWLLLQVIEYTNVLLHSQQEEYDKRLGLLI